MNDTEILSHASLIKKALTQMLKIDECVAAKHKIALSWPYET